ncbi:MAG: YbfB/YjiJ family MFS transporter, partial [Micromonosporaceae bacterium]
MAFGFARYGSGLFLPSLRAEFGFSITQAGLISSAAYAGYLVALVVVGAAVARIGPRPLIIAAGVSATVGLALVAAAPGVAQMVVGLVLAGASSGLAWAPYSDVVQTAVPDDAREHVLGVLPSGTAWGVLVAGPLALVTAGSGWRVAWWAFAVVAFLVTLWNARILPRSGARQARTSHRVGPSLFLRTRAVPLYLTALSYGITGSVYWLFAVQAVTDATRAGTSTPALLWTLIGLSGITGALTGHVIKRRGLRVTHTLLLSGLTAAIAMLAVAPGSPAAIVISGSLYGATFMAISGLLAVWSYQVFPEHPATGFSATVFFLGIGTLVGPAVLGAAADRYGLPVTLLAMAGIAALTLPLRPTRTCSRHARPESVP